MIRLAYGWIAYSQNFFPDLFLDSQHYAGIAKAITEGRGSGDTAYVMSPLYPYFLTLFINEAGEFAVWWVRSVQMLTGVISCVLVAALAKHYGGLLSGWIGGITFAFYGPLIHYENAILVEVMQGFTLILALWLLVVLKPNNQKKQAGQYFSVGLLLGLAAGFRPVALLIVAISLVVLFGLTLIQNPPVQKNTLQNIFSKKSALRQKFLLCCLLFLGTATAVLPFTVRNYIVEKEFVLLSAYGGMNFWIGNHRNASGLFNTPPGYGFHLDPIGVEVASKTTGKELSQKEASDWWSNRAMQDIKDDPLRWLSLYTKKISLFFHYREIPQLGNDFHWFAKKAWPLQLPLNALPLLLLAITLPISLLLFKQPQTLLRLLLPYSWLLVYIAGISLFFITGRYRTPIMPIVFVLAASHAGLLARQLISARSYMTALVIIVALLFSTVAVTRGFNSQGGLPASSMVSGLVERQRGMAFYNKKDYQEAERWYRLSLGIKESAMTRGNLANTLKAQGRIDEAEAEYRKALAASPKDHVILYNLGNLYRDYKKDYVQAAQYYERSIAINRKFAEPYLNLALLYMRMQKPDQAEEVVSNGLATINSTQHKVREQLIRLKVQLALQK